MALDDLVKIIKETPISQIVGAYVPLVHKGATIMGRCPFHDDKNPSMAVSDSKGLFMCFACNTGGDAISFVQKKLHVDFKESLKEISRILGIDYTRYQNENKKDPRRELALKILERSATLFQKVASIDEQNLYKDFLSKRKISPEVAQKFQLGLAPANNLLTHYFESIQDENTKDQTIKMALELTLIRASKRGTNSHYDTFRQRIIFPIWDQYGKTIGFTSRSLFPDQNPKYLNSQESFVFSKKNLLYGLHLAKTSIREKGHIILVEGNMDVMALHQRDFTQAVGIMGTAFNQTTLQNVLHYSKQVYLCFDNDDAGKKTMQTATKQFMEHGISPKYIDLGKWKDPDEFLINEGPINFQEKINKAPAAIDVIIRSILPAKAPEVVDVKLQYLNQVFELLSPFGRSLEVSERLANVAQVLALKSSSEQILKIYEDYLEAAMEQSENKPHQGYAQLSANLSSSEQDIDKEPKLETELSEEKNDSKDHANLLPKKPISLNRGEKILLQELIKHPDALEHSNLSELLAFVQCDEVKRMVCSLQKLHAEVVDSEFTKLVPTFLEKEGFPQELKSVVAPVLFSLNSPLSLDESKAKQLLMDIQLILEKEILKSKRNEWKKLQAQSENEEELHNILKEMNKLQIEINNLQKNTSLAD